MSRSSSSTSTGEARRRGRLAMVALRTVVVGMFSALGLYAVVSAFLTDPPAPPPWPWALAVLVAPAALAVYWRPVSRVPNCLFLTGASAFFLGLVGASFGSLVAPAVGGMTLLALFFAPRDGGWQAQWGRDADRGDGADGVQS